MSLPPIDNYIITYSNHFEFNGRKLAFRNKILFDITGTPSLIPKSDQGWWIGRNLLSETNAKNLVKMIPVSVNLTGLQWYVQINIDYCFNLD